MTSKDCYQRNNFDECIFTLRGVQKIWSSNKKLKIKCSKYCVFWIFFNNIGFFYFKCFRNGKRIMMYYWYYLEFKVLYIKTDTLALLAVRFSSFGQNAKNAGNFQLFSLNISLLFPSFICTVRLNVEVDIDIENWRTFQIFRPFN